MSEDVHAPSVKDLTDQAREYVDTKIELVKLKAINKASSVASSLASMIILPLLVLVVIILLSVGLSFWLGRMLGAYHYGFFITGSCLLFLILIIYKFRDRLLKIPIANSLIKNILK